VQRRNELVTRHARLGFVLALSALAAWVGYASGSRSGSRAMHELDASTAAAATPVRAVAKPSTASGPRANLAERIPDLAERADAGDRNAARTLAEGLGRCLLLPQLEQSTFGDERYLEELRKRNAARGRDERSSKGEDAVSLRVEAARAELASTQEECAGVSREQTKSVAHWMYRAALLGDSKSALEFGIGTFISTDMLGQLEQIPFWREHSEEMLERALAGGESSALMTLAAAHDPMKSGSFDAPRYATDAAAAYAYYTAMSLLPGSQAYADAALARLEPQLTDAERDDALAKAADICLNDLPTVCSLPASGAR
jgi:hypothetical protein